MPEKPENPALVFLAGYANARSDDRMKRTAAAMASNQSLITVESELTERVPDSEDSLDDEKGQIYVIKAQAKVEIHTVFRAALKATHYVSRLTPTPKNFQKSMEWTLAAIRGNNTIEGELGPQDIETIQSVVNSDPLDPLKMAIRNKILLEAKRLELILEGTDPLSDLMKKYKEREEQLRSKSLDPESAKSSTTAAIKTLIRPKSEASTGFDMDELMAHTFNFVRETKFGMTEQGREFYKAILIGDPAPIVEIDLGDGRLPVQLRDVMTDHVNYAHHISRRLDITGDFFSKRIEEVIKFLGTPTRNRGGDIIPSELLNVYAKAAEKRSSAVFSGAVQTAYNRVLKGGSSRIQKKKD